MPSLLVVAALRQMIAGVGGRDVGVKVGGVVSQQALADKLLFFPQTQQVALEKSGIERSVWRIHRRIGMSGGLFVNALLRETGHQLTREEAAHLQQMHAEAYLRLAPPPRPLPGARELLAYLTKSRVPWAIATSGRMVTAAPALRALGIPSGVPVVTSDQVEYSKPDPDLFLTAAR